MPRDKALIRTVEEVLDCDWPLPIVQAGDPILRQHASEVTDQLSPKLLRKLIDAMFVTMRDAPGVGLAAPQVGVPLALAVVEDEGDEEDTGEGSAERLPLESRALFNPVYRPVGTDRTFFYEGCLSIAGWYAKVERHRSIALTTREPGSAERTEQLTGWPARIVQHETDHLNGVLFTDLADMTTLASAENLSRFSLD